VASASAPAPAHAQGTAAAAVSQARLCTRGTGEVAVNACRRALELGLPAPRQPAVEATLASRLAALERWDDVIAVYRGAVSRRPADAAVRLRLGAALLHMQDRAADAEPELREAIRLAPDDPEAHVLLGSALAVLGRSAEAVGAFEQALRLDPSVLEHRPAASAALEAARGAQRWPRAARAPSPPPPSS
jgi:tetratricopeptide (TPR) repeat protein